MLVVGLWHVALAPCAPTRVGRVRQPPTMVADPTARLPRVPQSPEEMVEQAVEVISVDKMKEVGFRMPSL